MPARPASLPGRRLWRGFLIAVIAVMGCDRSRSDTAGSEAVASPGVSDSVRPRSETLATFRRGLDSVNALASVAASREELVTDFMVALEQSDTSALQRLLITPAEFAWLYYPTNPQGLPPYGLTPGLMWFMLQAGSRKGLSQLLKDRAGLDLRYLSTECLGDSSIQGENTVYGPCVVERVSSTGDTVRERLFGLVMEREGRWKFVSYANKY